MVAVDPNRQGGGPADSCASHSGWSTFVVRHLHVARLAVLSISPLVVIVVVILPLVLLDELAVTTRLAILALPLRLVVHLLLAVPLLAIAVLELRLIVRPLLILELPLLLAVDLLVAAPLLATAVELRLLVVRLRAELHLGLAAAVLPALGLTTLGLAVLRLLPLLGILVRGPGGRTPADRSRQGDRTGDTHQAQAIKGFGSCHRLLL